MHRVSPQASADDDATDCPLCMEEIDPTDRHFKPCPCGYQVCRFCWNRIRQNENERCPACRRVYTDDAVEFTPLSTEELSAISRARKKREPSQHHLSTSSMTTTRKEFLDEEDGPVLPSRKHLVEVRVTQKNLVYVIGIPMHLADEHILKQEEYFGRFGKIVKLVINKRAYVRTTGSGAINNAAAYITYARDEEALRAIKLVDGKMIEGAKLLRATYGTTKYCAHFLRGKTCPKSGCLYLHHEVFDNEISTGMDSVSNKDTHSVSTSPPASPSPTTGSHELLESDRVKSFFERLQKWTRIDELLADLSVEPDIVKTASSTLEPSEISSFNPFDDPFMPSSILIKDATPEVKEPEGGSLGRADIPPRTILQPVDKASIAFAKKTPPKAFTTAQLSGKKSSHPSERPFQTTEPVEKVADFSASPSQAQSASYQAPQTPKAPIVVQTVTKSAQKQQPLLPVQPPGSIKKSPPVANDNLFSVLSVEDINTEGYDESEGSSEKEAIEDKKQTEEKKKAQPPAKKPGKKDPKKQLEEDLDELLKQVEPKPQTKTLEAKPQTTSQSPQTPILPLHQQQKKSTIQRQPALNTLISALSASGGINANGKLEEEAAHRVVELEKILRDSKLDAREVEDRLRETVLAFLQSMNITLDDDYLQ